MAKKKETTKLVHVEPDTHQKLKNFAEKNGMKMTHIVTEAIEDRLRRAKPATK